MKKLYRFYWDCRREGEVVGLFAADEESVRDAVGKQVYFGEILGKHSEIYGTLNKEDLTVLTEDQDFIEKAEECGLLPSGYNPLEYTRK